MSHLPAILVASVVIVAVGLPIIFLALYGTDASRGAGNWDTPASSEEGVIALMCWLRPPSCPQFQKHVLAPPSEDPIPTVITYLASLSAASNDAQSKKLNDYFAHTLRFDFSFCLFREVSRDGVALLPRDLKNKVA